MRIRKIAGREIEADELAAELLKGSGVLAESGGGITISGGEPLAQPQFLFELMDKLKPLNIAVETSGYAGRKIFSRMVAEADLILMDVKHTDPDVHIKYTGRDNRLILQNLDYLCHSDTDFCIRIPLIPGVNDSRENIEETARIIKNSKHLIRVELLPYNCTAGAKYRMLGRDYQPGFNENRKVKVHKDIFEKNGIEAVVL